MRKKLRLYVWQGVLADYTDGVMFALAYSVDEARKLCLESAGNYGFADDELKAEPDVYEKPFGLALHGGG